MTARIFRDDDWSALHLSSGGNSDLIAQLNALVGEDGAGCPCLLCGSGWAENDCELGTATAVVDDDDLRVIGLLCWWCTDFGDAEILAALENPDVAGRVIRNDDGEPIALVQP